MTILLRTGGTLWSEIGVLFLIIFGHFDKLFPKFQQVSNNFHRLVCRRAFWIFVKIHRKLRIKQASVQSTVQYRQSTPLPAHSLYSSPSLKLKLFFNHYESPCSLFVLLYSSTLKTNFIWLMVRKTILSRWNPSQ